MLRTMTITEIKELLAASVGDRQEELLRRAQADERAGVRQLAAGWRRGLDRDSDLILLAERMTRYERKLVKEGYKFIAGVDEVGRGSLAGPLVAAAVILPAGSMIKGLKDSKQLSASVRLAMDEKIKAVALGWKIVAIENFWIDRHGLHRANLIALAQAAAEIEPQPDFLLSDGFSVPLCPLPQLKLTGGDSASQSIAAASVIAKVYRDNLMTEAGAEYPQYEFAKNKGYGSKEHLDALHKHGPCELHRQSFSPVNTCREEQLFLSAEPKSAKDQ